jgi:hypothetical protein
VELTPVLGEFERNPLALWSPVGLLLTSCVLLVAQGLTRASSGSRARGGSGMCFCLDFHLDMCGLCAAFFCFSVWEFQRNGKPRNVWGWADMTGKLLARPSSSTASTARFTRSLTRTGGTARTTQQSTTAGAMRWSRAATSSVSQAGHNSFSSLVNQLAIFA